MSGADSQILLTGGTGRIGGELARMLRDSNQRVRAISRNPERAEFLKRLGVEILREDLSKPNDLAAVTAGVQQLFLLSSDHPLQAERECALLDAAVRAGVRRVVKVSAFAAGLEPPISYGVQHRRTEDYLRASGLAWTILRPYMFMQNFCEFGDLIASKKMFMAPFGKTKIALIDARDVAAVAHAVIMEGEHESQVYELTGPAAISCTDVARILAEVLGHPVRYKSVPAWLAGLAMRREGVAAWDVKMRKQLFGMIKAGGEAQTNDLVETITGTAARSLEVFARDHREHFKLRQ